MFDQTLPESPVTNHPQSNAPLISVAGLNLWYGHKQA